MANPAVTALTNRTVTKVATNITSGVLSRLVSATKYFATYRLTGQSAPTLAAFFDEAKRIFASFDQEEITNSVGIDVYVVSEDDSASSQTCKIKLYGHTYAEDISPA